MKRLGWLIGFVLSFSLYAQDVVVNPPLSLEPEAGQHLKEPVEGTLVPAKVQITEDGQLKLEDKKTPEKLPEENKPEAQPVVETKAETQPVFSVYNFEKYLQFSYGYLDSHWNKAEPTMENGSTLTTFRFAADMTRHNQVGFAIEMIGDRGAQTAPDNIRAIQSKLFLDHHRTLFEDKLDYLMGLAVSVGDYSIKRLEINSSGQEVYAKVKSGTLIGLIPSTGLRFYLVGKNSIDIAVEYHHYFSKPQRHIGGIALAPRFSFVF